MTSLYFVRHAQPNHDREDDRTRQLTGEGLADSGKVTEFLKNVKVDSFISSPYTRSFDTIKGSADEKKMTIMIDERLRERKNGPESNVFGMYQKRWNDFNLHEDGGESLNMVQMRNVEAVADILENHPDENVVIGTHGTALSTILNHYKPTFGCEDFLRIVDYMPYIIRLDFVGQAFVWEEELLIVEKEFKGKKRADKK